MLGSARATLRLCALVALATACPAQAGWDQAFKLKANDAKAGDQLGCSVALSGNTALVGNWTDADNGVDSGSAYLFNATTGAQIAKLKPSDGAEYDWFAYDQVALSGSLALVGSSGDDDNGSDSGSAYLFDVTTGAQIRKLKPNDGAAIDNFGYAVALSGNFALVGSPGDSDNGTQSGSAYLFNTATGAQIRKLKPSDGATENYFGSSVALSGNIALVGSTWDDDNGIRSGSAYLFDAATGDQIAKLKPNDGAARDHFGLSLAVSGNIALIGSPGDDDNGTDSGSAYLFDATTGAQIRKLKPNDGEIIDNFGYSLALSGNTALIGSWGDDDHGVLAGSVYLFNASTGAQIAKLKPGDGAAGDRFGYSVALSGNTALVGSPLDYVNGTDTGSAYLFSQDLLIPDPVSGGLISFSPVSPLASITLDDIPSIANTGGPGSVIHITGFAFSGPGASLFDLPGFSPVTLTAGAFDTIAYDLMFLGSGTPGDYTATLTLFTDSGDVSYDIAATVVPEPTSLCLILGGALALRRRDRRIHS